MVACYIKKIIISCLLMIGDLFDVVIVASTEQRMVVMIEQSRSPKRSLKNVTSHLKTLPCCTRIPLLRTKSSTVDRFI